MAIEKRTVANGIVVGFNTETNSYCNLPADVQQYAESANPLAEMDAAQLTAYAAAHMIDIGKAETAKGILEKIKAAQG